MLQEANRNGGKELRNSRPGLVSRFREVSGDLLVHLRQERLLLIDQRERECLDLVDQLCLKLRRFLGELVQKVRACFW